MCGLRRLHDYRRTQRWASGPSFSRPDGDSRGVQKPAVLPNAFPARALTPMVATVATAAREAKAAGADYLQTPEMTHGGKSATDRHMMAVIGDGQDHPELLEAFRAIAPRQRHPFA